MIAVIALVLAALAFVLAVLSLVRSWRMERATNQWLLLARNTWLTKSRIEANCVATATPVQIMDELGNPVVGTKIVCVATWQQGDPPTPPPKPCLLGACP